MAQLKECKACSKEVSKSAKTCPHCGQKLKGGFLKWLLIILGVLFLLGIIGSMMEGGETSSDETSSKASNSETHKVETIFANLSCGALLAEVSENEAAFSRKYKGKTVQISGTVDSINETFGKTQVNLSSGKEFDFNSCSVYPNKKDEWPFSLKKGSRITVTCQQVSEVIGSVNLNKCQLN